MTKETFEMNGRIDAVATDKKAEIWSSWLNGDSITRIARWGPVSSPARVRAVLDEGTPDQFGSDPRLLYAGRFYGYSDCHVEPALRRCFPSDFLDLASSASR